MAHVLDRLMGVQRLLREALASAWAHRGAAEPDPGHQAVDVRLGDTTVSITIAIGPLGGDGPCFVNLHENEQTSVAAARAVLALSAGRLVRLRHRGRRLVVFWHGLRPHAFDPNRIFSDAGIRRTLLRHASLTAQAFAAVRALRERLLPLICSVDGHPVVALHNNAGRQYSVLAYQAGGSHGGDASALAVASAWPAEDFFVVTQALWFERLRDLGFNVVLQSPSVADDGSLSVWCQHHGVVYLNVEARHGRLAAQQQMLRAITGPTGF
jgi:hypothetical protein